MAAPHSLTHPCRTPFAALGFTTPRGLTQYIAAFLPSLCSAPFCFSRQPDDDGRLSRNFLISREKTPPHKLDISIRKYCCCSWPGCETGTSITALEHGGWYGTEDVAAQEGERGERRGGREGKGGGHGEGTKHKSRPRTGTKHEDGAVVAEASAPGGAWRGNRAPWKETLSGRAKRHLGGLLKWLGRAVLFFFVHKVMDAAWSWAVERHLHAPS